MSFGPRFSIPNATAVALNEIERGAAMFRPPEARGGPVLRRDGAVHRVGWWGW